MNDEDWPDPRVRRITGVTDYGYLRVDAPYISEVLPGLWQGGCGHDLILPSFISHLISLYPWQRYEVRHELQSDMHVSMYDSAEQVMGQVPLLAAWVNQCRKTGPVLVHCQAGLNRSGLVVATALMLDGYTAGRAIRLLREERSPAVLCNPAFEAWLRSRPLGGTLLTPKEAAAALDVSTRTLARWAGEGKLTEMKTPGGAHRYYEDEVEELRT